MKTRSIKVNYFLNLFRVVFSTLVGLFTLPYINRVLGANSLGKVEYVNSIITYFLLFSALGIPMYGIREVAKVKADKKERSKLVFELLSILVVTTIISYLIIFGVLLQFNYFNNLKLLIIIMSSMVVFSNFGVEWFYQGIEDQVFITVRYTIVRVFTLVLLFILVKSPQDYLWYGFIIVLTTVGSNIFNLIYLKKYLLFSDIKFSELNIQKHFKPIFTIFVATISVSIYIQLDNIMLGSFAGTKAVGYYAMANKLIRFVILFITTLGAVLLPRMSHLVHSEKELYYHYSQKAINYIFFIAVPFTFIFIFLAEDLTILMGGEQFRPAILTMQLLSPIIIVVGIAYFLGYLVLYPQGKEKFYTIATVFSAILSILLNLYAAPKYGQNGTAAVAVLSEIFGILLLFMLIRSELKKIVFFNQSLFIYVVASVSMICFVYVCNQFTPPMPLLAKVTVELILAFSMFMFILVLFKEKIFLEILGMIRNWLNMKRWTAQ